VALGDHKSTLARAVIRLGDSLHLRTVAEGIESADQVNSLIRMGCEFGQGYYFGKPLPAEDIESLLMADAPLALGG
jgi:EAL domain-containing protein (putative c-di-GMP-specific phosphodiesterase class I)